MHHRNIVMRQRITKKQVHYKKTGGPIIKKTGTRNLRLFPETRNKNHC